MADIIINGILVQGDAPSVPTVPVPTPDMIRAETGRRIRALGSKYSDGEVDTWPQQVEEVKRFDADPLTADCPILSRRAAAVGVPLTDYVSWTRAHIETFSEQTGVLLAAQDRLLAMAPNYPTDFKTNETYWVEPVS